MEGDATFRETGKCNARKMSILQFCQFFLFNLQIPTKIPTGFFMLLDRDSEFLKKESRDRRLTLADTRT